MHCHARECELDAGPSCLGHEPAPRGLALQPIAELTRAVQMHAAVQPDDAQELARLPGQWYISWRDYESAHLEVFALRTECP